MERRCAATPSRWRTHSSRKRTARETRATRTPGAMATAQRAARVRKTSLLHTLRKRHGEKTRLADSLRYLAKARRRDELIELRLRPPAHHPRAASMTLEPAGDQLELRM